MSLATVVTAARISELLADLDHWVGQLTPGLYGSNQMLFWLVAEIPREECDDCRATAECKARTLTYEDLSVLLFELALEKESDQHLNAYRPEGGNSGNHGRGHQGSRPGKGTTPKNAGYCGNVQDLFWCDVRDEQRGLVHAPDCDQHECFVVQGKKQETNTGGKAKLPDHYRCTITCAFCGKRKHYEDECYHKQRLSNKLKSEAKKSGGGAGGKSQGEKGKDKSQGRAKAKVKHKAKVEDAEAQTGRTRTRTRTRTGTGPGETPPLRQGGPILSPLVSSKRRGLRPVPRRKPNKNKGLSLPTKMETSLTPTNVPASCGWRENCRRRGLK